jgi:hypothetical protein
VRVGEHEEEPPTLTGLNSLNLKQARVDDDRALRELTALNLECSRVTDQRLRGDEQPPCSMGQGGTWAGTHLQRFTEERVRRLVVSRSSERLTQRACHRRRHTRGHHATRAEQPRGASGGGERLVRLPAASQCAAEVGRRLPYSDAKVAKA